VRPPPCPPGESEGPRYMTKPSPTTVIAREPCEREDRIREPPAASWKRPRRKSHPFCEGAMRVILMTREGECNQKGRLFFARSRVRPERGYGHGVRPVWPGAQALLQSTGHCLPVPSGGACATGRCGAAGGRPGTGPRHEHPSPHRPIASE